MLTFTPKIRGDKEGIGRDQDREEETTICLLDSVSGESIACRCCAWIQAPRRMRRDVIITNVIFTAPKQPPDCSYIVLILILYRSYIPDIRTICDIYTMCIRNTLSGVVFSMPKTLQWLALFSKTFKKMFKENRRIQYYFVNLHRIRRCPSVGKCCVRC